MLTVLEFAKFGAFTFSVPVANNLNGIFGMWYNVVNVIGKIKFLFLQPGFLEHIMTWCSYTIPSFSEILTSADLAVGSLAGESLAEVEVAGAGDRPAAHSPAGQAARSPADHMTGHSQADKSPVRLDLHS